MPMTTKNTFLILAGDIGGTKTTLALFSTEKGINSPLTEQTYASQDHPGLSVIIDDFLSNRDEHPRSACFGVAGPVVSNTVQTTNLPWVISSEQLKAQHGFTQADLLNDLQAIAASTPYLPEKDLFTIQPGIPEPNGAIGVIAPGTGLGEAFLIWDGNGYTPCASEGGHVDFAPTDEIQSELLTFLKTEYEHVSYERVCSGMGIPNIYTFFNSLPDNSASPDIARRVKDADDPTPVIVQAAMDTTCPVCEKTLDMFIAILGSATGNLALKVMSTGGLYIGGGIPPRILNVLDSDNFRSHFQSKGRLSTHLEKMPVHVITNPKAALLGAAAHCMNRLKAEG